MKLDTWVLAGQSNMEGVGLLGDPRGSVVEDARVEQFTSAGRWDAARDPLHRLWESYAPVHQALLRPGLPGEERELSDAKLAARARELQTHGAGLGLAFGAALAELSGRRIGLIPAAHGGTTLDQWQPGHGGRPDDSLGTLYGAMLDRIRRARQRDGVVLRGVLWYQGESEALAVIGGAYGERFDGWLERLRQDLAEPELPLYAVQLGRLIAPADLPPGVESHWDLVREAQRTLPGRSRSTGVVAAGDLGLSDIVHIDAPGLERLGRRLARIAHAASTGPDVVRVERAGSAANGLETLRVVCSGVTGQWRPQTRLPGFRLRDERGEQIPGLDVIDARPDPADPAAIEVVTSAGQAAMLEGVALSYGQGLDPVMLAVDSADLPLPAFAPQPLWAGEGASHPPR